MKVIKTITVILLCMFTLRAHADDFKVIDLEYSMPIATPWMRVITSYSEWLSFYYEYLAANGIDTTQICDPENPYPVDCSPPAPIVDFEYYQIIIGGLGLRSDTSKMVVSDVDVTSNNELSINIIDLKSAEGCVRITLAIENYTMAAIAVPKSDMPININVEEATLKSCI